MLKEAKISPRERSRGLDTVQSPPPRHLHLPFNGVQSTSLHVWAIQIAALTLTFVRETSSGILW